MDFLGGITSLIGGLFGQRKTDQRLHEQMDFQERMSSTAYQRATKDMEAAGLNPMLAFQQGGASSPTGSFSAANDLATPAISTALQSESVQQTVKNMVEQNKNLQEQNKKIGAETALIGSQQYKVEAETNIAREMVEGAKAAASRAKSDQELLNDPAFKWIRMLGTAAGEVGRIFGGHGARQ